MKLLIGLGNPGTEYESTRHNVGFMVLDQLVQEWKISLNRTKFKGEYGEYFTEGGEKLLLIKPQTFMNLSGECVGPWVKFLKIPHEDILVIHDELDLPLGKLKAQWAAGPAGHNGIRSIIQHLGHQDFNRLRIGVGHPGTSKRVIGHVLAPFAKSEQEVLDQIIETSVAAVKTFIEKGLDPVCQMVNRKVVNNSNLLTTSS